MPPSVPSSIPVSPDAPLQWRTSPPIVRVWAFWFCLATLFACGALMVWGVTLFSASATAGILATGGGVLLAGLFGAHFLAIRRGWGFGWALQIGWSGLFLTAMLLAVALKFGFARAEEFPTAQKVLIGLAVVPALIHLWILTHWFKAPVRAWFGKSLKVL